MTSLLQLLALSATVAVVLAECVTRLRSDGIGSIVGHRLFGNGSVGVVDDYARFMIFDSAGVLFYKENLNLPNDPERSSKYRLTFAIITSTANQLYLMSSNDKCFTYAAGAVSITNSYGGSVRLTNWGPLLNFQDFGVGLGAYGFTLWQRYTSKLMYVNLLNVSYGTGSMFNGSYLARTSVNPLLNEFYVALLSNKTFIGGVDQPNYNFVPASGTAGSSVTTEASFEVITSSIGGNTLYTAFAGYYAWSASNKYPHYLRIKQRSNSATASLQITNYHIWSVALDNTTATKMYFLTYDGSLYWTTFSTSSISAPTLLVQDLFLKYASLEILSSTKLLLKTLDSMAIFDITTSALSIVVDVKPTGGRYFGSKMFVLTHNFNVSLYELSGSMPVKDNSFSYIGKVRELIVSTSNNRFYMLTSTALFTYSLTTYSQLASLSFSQAKTMTSATSIISFNDIAPLVLQPTKIMLLVYGQNGGNLDSAMLVLNEIDLTYQNHTWTGYFDNFFSLSISNSLNGTEFISLLRPDCLNQFYYTAPNVFIDPNLRMITKYTPLSNRPEIANMKNVMYIGLPSGDKQLPRMDMLAGSVHEGQTEGSRFSMSDRTTTNFDRWVWVGFAIPPNMMVQRLDGNLNKTLSYSSPTFLFITYPDLSTNHQLTSEDFTGGVGYQKPDDSFLFFRGEYEISKINPLECYADPTKGYQVFYYPCVIANCQTCSAFSPNKCIICNSGKLLKEDLSACLSTCNPGYLLNGMCYNNCPIEYYKYNAAVNTCETVTGCTVTRGKLILGDMCNSVASCPSGSTQNTSKYCTFSSTSSANLASTAIVANPCPTGQIYLQHYSLCVSNTNPFYVNYTVSGTTMYCDGSTHFYDIASKRCLKTCGFYSGLHPQMGLICTTAATCISIGMFTDDNTSGVKLCTSTCSATLWTNLISKACMPICPNPSTYSQISDRTCITTCGATVLTLETNKSCLTSSECLTSSLLKTPSTMTCSSSCGASLYFKAFSSECLTSAECTSSSMLLSTSDMKCVTACSGTQYLLASANQCLTATQCKAVSSSSGGGLLSEDDKKCVSTCGAVQYFLTTTSQCLTSAMCKAVSSGSGGGLLSEDDKKCVSACGAAQYILSTTSQCLTSAMCKAVPSGSGGGLLSEGDKKCVGTCNSTQFVLPVTSQCLTEAACLATSGYGKLSMYDRKCVSGCGTAPQQYLSSVTSKCWLSAECLDPALGNGMTNNVLSTCDDSCSTGLYRLVVSSECLTAAACKTKTVAQGGSLLSEENLLCVSGCAATQYLLASTSQCLSSLLCQAAFSGTGYVDEDSKTCVSACSSSQYKLISTRQCLSASQCKAAYSGAGLLSEVDDLCVSSCSSTQYMLISTKQCLTATECKSSFGGTGHLSASDKNCVSVCSASQYLDQSFMTCLLASECNSLYSGMGLTNNRDKTCLSSCPSDLYYLAATQQCVTATECYAINGNNGLISNSGMKCLAACQPSQYLLQSNRQCMTDSECRAYSSNTGLLSDSDKKCVLACQPFQYLLQSTQQCLLDSECVASGPSSGYLSDSDMKCLGVCGPTQYLISGNRKCVDETACWALSYLTAPTSRLCETSCAASEYRDSTNQICYTKSECSSLAMLTKTSSPDNLCVPACSASEYSDNAQLSCLTKLECTVGNSKFVVTTNMTCIDSCPSDQQFVVNRECLNACPVGYFFEESWPDCVLQCAEAASAVNPTYCLRYLNFRILSAEQVSPESVVVILEVYFESNSTSTVTSFSVELATLFKQVGIVTDTSTNSSINATQITKVAMIGNRVEIGFAPPIELKELFLVSVVPESSVEFKSNNIRVSFLNQSRTKLINVLPTKSSRDNDIDNINNTPSSKLSRYSAQSIATVKILTPLLMTTFLDMRAGSFLCLVAQTYTKLMMLTHLNFKLEYNTYSVMYYNVFKEFLDNYNEVLMTGIVGTNIVTINKQYVCDHGYDKLCYLTVEDNFFMSHMLALIIFAIQAIVLYMVSQICSLLKFKTIGDLFSTKLKKVMLYSFILENGIEFWFTLLLNALIFVYRIAILSVMKLAGHLILVTFIVFLYKMLTRKSSDLNKIAASPNHFEQGVVAPTASSQKVFEVVFRRLRSIVKEITKEQTASGMLKCLMIHDSVFAMLLVPGRFLGDYQMVVWLAVEVVLLFLLSKYRPFSTRVLNIRQIAIEFLFLVLLIFMTMVPHLKSSNLLLSMIILMISMLILVIDMIFVISEIVKTAITLVKGLINKKKPSPQTAHTKSTMLSFRNDFHEASKTMGRLDKIGSESVLIKKPKRISISSISNKDNKVLHELASRHKDNSGSRKSISMLKPRNNSPSNRHIQSPSLNMPESENGDAVSIRQSTKGSPLKIRSSRMIANIQTSETRNLSGSLRQIENKSPVRLRPPRQIALELGHPQQNNYVKK